MKGDETDVGGQPARQQLDGSHLDVGGLEEQGAEGCVTGGGQHIVLGVGHIQTQGAQVIILGLASIPFGLQEVPGNPRSTHTHTHTHPQSMETTDQWSMLSHTQFTELKTGCGVPAQPVTDQQGEQQPGSDPGRVEPTTATGAQSAEPRALWAPVTRQRPNGRAEHCLPCFVFTLQSVCDCHRQGTRPAVFVQMDAHTLISHHHTQKRRLESTVLSLTHNVYWMTLA